MEKLKTRRILGITVLAFMMTFFTMSSVFATNDNIDYRFRIGINKNYSQETDGRFRQTLNPKNPWKVKLETSQEGKGTITTFWLADQLFGVVSYYRDAKQGAGAYYTEAMPEASNKMVYLTGQNNNWSSVAYIVEGKWDEETW